MVPQMIAPFASLPIYIMHVSTFCPFLLYPFIALKLITSIKKIITYSNSLDLQKSLVRIILRDACH